MKPDCKEDILKKSLKEITKNKKQTKVRQGGNRNEEVND
jgi:hypothetical protein